MARVLSGIQPSGLPHLGNYFGAILQHLEASQSNDPKAEPYFFIADYHALTTMHDPAQLDYSCLREAPGARRVVSS